MPDPKLCAVCGDTIEEGEGVQPIPVNGQWVHADASDDGCESRYRDPPGEAFLTEESW